MPLFNLTELRAALGRNDRLIGIDPGSKTIGIALSDVLLTLASGLPVALWDERLSSAAVNRFLVNEADLSRKKRADAVDRMAAAWTLQAALDASR